MACQSKCVTFYTHVSGPAFSLLHWGFLGEGEGNWEWEDAWRTMGNSTFPELPPRFRYSRSPASKLPEPTRSRQHKRGLNWGQSPTLLGGKWRGRWGWLQEGNLKNVFLSFALLFCDPLGNLCGDRGAMLTSVLISPLQKSPWSNEIHLRCRDHVLYMDCGYHNSYSIGAKLGLQLRKPYLWQELELATKPSGVHHLSVAAGLPTAAYRSAHFVHDGLGTTPKVIVLSVKYK